MLDTLLTAYVPAYVCSAILHNGEDVYSLARLMGREEVRTTEVYLRAMQEIQVRKRGFSVLDAI